MKMGRCIRLNVKYVPKWSEDKLIALKLDNLWKHGGRKKALVAIPIVYKAREVHMKKYLVHAKNEHMYANVKEGTIAN
jgi:hypothetical protein